MSDPEQLTVRLVRPDSQVSWGFRLQGGADFSTPLSIQSVAPQSVAERSGLHAGDAVIFVNNTVSDSLSHDDAKREILRSGNDLTLTCLRGAVQIWKPKVTPISDLKPGQMRTVQLAGGQEVQTAQKTSLEKEPQESLDIGTGYNRSARPFGAPKAATPNIVHAQFNSPIGLYSADNLAATYNMQTKGIQQEVNKSDLNQAPIGTRVSGTYQPIEGEEDEEEPDTHASEPTPPESNDIDHQPPPSSVNPPLSDNQQEDDNGSLTNKYPQPSGFRSVNAPVAQPMSPGRQQQQASMHCGKCGNMVTGVFVKVKGVAYHPQCFTCTSCGINLKQKGYFVVEDQLYCEVHAKRLVQPPDQNMKSVTVYR